MQKQILSLFWQTSNKNKRLRNVSLVLPVLAVLTNGIVAPLVISKFLNLLQKNQVTFDNSINLIILYAILVILGEIVIWRLALYFIWMMETRGIQLLYNSITSKLLDHSMHFHANRFGGSIVSQASKLIRAYERFWDMIYWSMHITNSDNDNRFDCRNNPARILAIRVGAICSVMHICRRNTRLI